MGDPVANRLTGKSALITAAGQGIGRATALAYAAEGAQVLATDVDEAALAALAGTPNLTTQCLDVTSEAALAAVYAASAPPNILVNCAGYVHHGSILDCPPERWDFSFNLNVRAMYLVMRAFVPGMLAQGGGSIVNIASVAGQIKGVPDRCAYGASKAAVIGLTKSVAADYVGKGLRCNAICPGTVDTPSLGDRINAFADPVKARQDFIARQPMGRLGKAEEIAQLSVYLASDEAAFVTGQYFIIDGGMTT